MCKLKYFDKFKLNVGAPFIYWAMTLWANMMCFLMNIVIDVPWSRSFVRFGVKWFWSFQNLCTNNINY